MRTKQIPLKQRALLCRVNDDSSESTIKAAILNSVANGKDRNQLSWCQLLETDNRHVAMHGMSESIKGRDNWETG